MPLCVNISPVLISVRVYSAAEPISEWSTMKYISMPLLQIGNNRIRLSRYLLTTEGSQDTGGPTKLSEHLSGAEDRIVEYISTLSLQQISIIQSNRYLIASIYLSIASMWTVFYSYDVVMIETLTASPTGESGTMRTRYIQGQRTWHHWPELDRGGNLGVPLP